MNMNAYEKYEQELFSQKTPYLQWLKAQEAEMEQRYGGWQNQDSIGKQVHKLPFSSCLEHLQGDTEICADEIYLFVKDGGTLSDYAAAVFAEAFCGSADVVFAYADEDYRGSLRALYDIEESEFEEEITTPYRSGADDRDVRPRAQYRGAPWFKPGFSPDTLASFFYIGSVFAIRGNRLLKIAGGDGSGLSTGFTIYELVYRIFMEALDRKQHGMAEGIVHIPRVLYTSHSLAEAERIDSSAKIMAQYRGEGQADRIDYDRDHDKISIVIPSKDNAAILQKCLRTLVQYTKYDCYEIIIVDNGSCPEQRMWITRILDELKEEKMDLAVQYLYEESAFNFSAMCNMGARSANGTYLLFLNDDIEIIGTKEGGQWLDRMLAYARKPHVGAVGAKLYYPSPDSEGDEGYRIQHAGITNMGIGPAHKLGGMIDAGCLYHGHNTQNYDMLAVTAACMLIRRCVFDEAGGFDESFPVAYNDVELCFRLYERGYFNVQVNEAALIHHESLSRGHDTDAWRQERLAAEKRRLYQKHMALNARDPFYSANLVQWKKDTDYNTGYLYAFDRPVKPSAPGNDKRKRMLLKMHSLRAFLRDKWRLVAKIYDRLTGYHDIVFHIDNVGYVDGIDDGIIDDKITDNNLMNDLMNNLIIEGWCAVQNTDNADLPRKLWLIRTDAHEDVYEFTVSPKLREDVAAVLEADQSTRTRNTALSGIQVIVEEGALQPGTYRVGVVCNNRLVCDQEACVLISGTDTKDEEGKV